MNLKCFKTSLFLLLTISCFAQVNEKLSRIESEITQVMTAENIPAISVGIVLDGETYFINQGHHDRSNQKQVSEESLYQLASLGKTFVGIIVNNLLLEKKIRLDQPITDFLPDTATFSKKRKQKLQQITIDHLLHHRSGFPQDARAGYRRKDGDAYRYNYTEENFHRDLCKRRIKPGNNYQYSNFGYALLAYLMEQATNSTYEELLQKYLAPYGLENTTLELNATQKNQMVTPYRKDKRMVATQPWSMGKLAPPSAAYSNTKDLTNLLKAQLKAYQAFANTKKVTPLYLSKNTKAWRDHKNIKYGYGFFSLGDNFYGHGGDMDGYVSNYVISVDGNFGLVLLSSSGEKWVQGLVVKINRILGE